MEYEEPRVERALDEVMRMLDERVPRSVWVTRADELHHEAAFAGESLLRKPENEELNVEVEKARLQAKEALRRWLTALNDLLHHSRG